MNKKRLGNVAVLMVFLGGMIYHSIFGTVRVQVDAPEQTVPQDMTETWKIEEKQACIDHILQTGTRDFFMGYPVDESFLWWFTNRFGQETLTNLDTVCGAENAEGWTLVSDNSIHALWAMYCNELQFDTPSLERVSFGKHPMGTGEDISLLFLGDITLAEDWCTTDYMDECENGLFQSVSMDVMNTLHEADITVANHEFVLSNRGIPTEGKEYIFRGNPTRGQMLAALGIDLVSLGNNHVYDHGEIGLLDTMDNLKAQEVSFVGAGRNIEEAMAPHYYVEGGRKIAFVSGTQIERYIQYTKEAGVDSPGVLKAKDPEKLCRAIEEAKQNSDYVVVLIHWGTEGYIKEEGSQVELAEAFVDAGADLIVGSHPHRMEGVTYIREVPVIYSLGNFLLSDSDLYTGIAQVVLHKDGKEDLRLLPAAQKNQKVELLYDSDEVTKFYHYVTECSTGIAIKKDATIVDALAQSPDKEQILYWSGKKYENFSGDEDLQGRKIDIVGILQ
ncbi:MAG: CapA family protein [Agathobacter sp.]|nr:CapA family protein [Agathobacter sp.]